MRFMIDLLCCGINARPRAVVSFITWI